MNDWSVHDNCTDWDHESFYERTLSQIWSRSFFGQHNIILIKDMKSKKLNYYRKKKSNSFI